jgi:hypothetical protein
MNEFVRQTKNKLTLKEFEVLNTSNLDYVGNYMGFNIQNEEKKLSIKIVFIEVSRIHFHVLFSIIKVGCNEILSSILARIEENEEGIGVQPMYKTKREAKISCCRPFAARSFNLFGKQMTLCELY